jgi:NAD(P)-dependent dehydrogenase (short-subunit alcohol dehydrogenase family)
MRLLRTIYIMTTTPKIALVSGANRGLGLETCRQLAQQGLEVILSARDNEKGQAAVKNLRDTGLNVRFHALDVSSETSISLLYDFIMREYGRLDVLVNNAGVFLDPRDNAHDSSIFNANIDTVRHSMETNLYGPLRLCQAFIPQMRTQNYGRVVNVSSGMGQLSDMNGCCPGYRTSKTALNALTRIFADELRATEVLINSVCPGWVRTDMGGTGATRDVDAGADTIVWLATLPSGGPSGGFFRDRTVIAW